MATSVFSTPLPPFFLSSLSPLFLFPSLSESPASPRAVRPPPAAAAGAARKLPPTRTQARTQHGPPFEPACTPQAPIACFIEPGLESQTPIVAAAYHNLKLNPDPRGAAAEGCHTSNVGSRACDSDNRSLARY